MDLAAPLADELARDFQVISYQLRGEDDWSALRQRFGLAELAGDLAEFLDWMGLERPAVLGVSFGGVVALEAAIRRPALMRSLVLQGVGPRFEAGLLQQVAGVILARYPLPFDNPFVNQFFNLFFGRKQPPGPLFDFVTRQCWQTDQGVMAHRFQMVEQVDFIGRTAGVRAPATLLVGDKDVLVSRPGLRELAAALPAGRAKVLAGAGHLAFVTHVAEVAEEARRALAGAARCG
jgi:pimeloyl-ACP methyl ester carboxylesterase